MKWPARATIVCLTLIPSFSVSPRTPQEPSKPSVTSATLFARSLTGIAYGVTPIVTDAIGVANRSRITARSAASAKKPLPGTQPKRPPTAIPPTSDLLDKLAWCESRMGQASKNYFQMKPRSSEALGLGPDPSIHPYEVQKEAAAKIHISRWPRQFPACSRKLGVR